MPAAATVRRPHVVVVGGGIAGLTAAYAMTRDGGDAVRVTVLEASPEIGGKLRVSEIAGVPVDEGAESMLARRPEGVALARALGLGDEVVPARTAAAGVWSRGAVRRLPAGQVMGVPTDLRALAASGVLSRWGLLRVPLDRVLTRTRVDGDVSVGSYVAARLGPEVVERLVEPLLGGVYAGHADALSLEATVPQLAGVARQDRSLLAGARRVRQASARGEGPVFVGLPGGLGRLPAALAAAGGATVRTGAAVRELCRTPDGWRLTVGPTRAPEAVDADAVVLALPARPASRLLSDVSPEAAGDLAAIDYASVAVVTLAYPATAFARAPAGSGFLVPPVEGRLVKAVTLTSQKWDWAARAAPGTVVLRCSVGRYGEEADLQRDDGELVGVVVADLEDMLGLPAVPLEARVTRWGGALPQYAVGHRARVARIRGVVDTLPGLEVCGAAYDGLGIPACVATAEAAAGRVRARLDRGGQWGHG